MYEMNNKINNKLKPLQTEISSQFINKIIERDGKISTKVKNIIPNVVACFIRNTFNKGDSVGITLNKNHYNEPAIINGISTKSKISYKFTLQLFEFLQSNDYIIIHKGGVETFGTVNGKWQATEFASGYLDLLPKLKLLYNLYSTCDVAKTIVDNVVIVRDEISGKDLSFRMTPYLRNKKSILDKFNTLSLTKDVQIKYKNFQL